MSKTNSCFQNTQVLKLLNKYSRKNSDIISINKQRSKPKYKTKGQNHKQNKKESPSSKSY